MTIDSGEGLRRAFEADAVDTGNGVDVATAWEHVDRLLAREPRRRNTRIAVAVSLATALAAFGVTGLHIHRAVVAIVPPPTTTPSTPSPSQSVPEPTPTTPAAPEVLVGAGAGRPAVGEGAVWVPQWETGELIKVDAASGRRALTIPISGSRTGPYAVVVTPGALWLMNYEAQQVWKLDDVTGAVLARIPVTFDKEGAIAAAGDTVWVLCCATQKTVDVLRIDASKATIAQRITVARPSGDDVDTISAGKAGVWVRGSTTMRRIDLPGGPSAAIQLPAAYAAATVGSPMAVGDTGVWLVAGDRLGKYDVGAGTFTDFPELSADPNQAAFAAYDGRIWLAAPPGLLEVDEKSGQVLQEHTGKSVFQLAAGPGGVWGLTNDSLVRIAATPAAASGTPPPLTATSWERIDGVFTGPPRAAYGPHRLAVVGKRLVAVGMGDANRPRTGPGVWLSDDGRTWRAVANDRIELGLGSEPAGIGMTDVVALPGGRLVAVGVFDFNPRNAPAVWLSDDAGESWRRSSAMPALPAGESASMAAVAVTAAGKVVAVGVRRAQDQRQLGAVVWVSENGTDWSALPDIAALTQATGLYLSSVATGGTTVVAVGGDSSGPLAVVTNDLKTWRRIDVPGGPGDYLSSVVRTDSGFLAVGATKSGDGVALSWDEAGKAFVNADPLGAFAGDGAQFLSGAAVTRSGSIVITGSDGGKAALWTGTGAAWIKVGGDDARWPKGYAGAVADTPHGTVVIGRPAGRTQDSVTLLWLGTP